MSTQEDMLLEVELQSKNQKNTKKIETEDQEIEQIHSKSSSQESNLFLDVTS